MAIISLKNIGLSYSIYGASGRSLKRSLLDVATGGNLKKTRDNEVLIEALKNITLDLHAGDRLALVGHNGAGKSTLLRILAGIYEPTHGTYHVEGTIGTLLDIYLGLDQEATGYENIRIRGEILRLSRRATEALIPDIEAFTEMGNFLSVPVRTYSSGMMVRLSFALSTMQVPDILIVDEAIGAGDAHFMKKAQERMNNIIATSKILVLASHDPSAIRQFTNKALWLEHGTIKAFGDTESIMQQYEATT